MAKPLTRPCPPVAEDHRPVPVTHRIAQLVGELQDVFRLDPRELLAQDRLHLRQLGLLAGQHALVDASDPEHLPACRLSLPADLLPGST